MKMFMAVAAIVLLTAAPAAAGDGPPPKGNDTGCCFSFDDSPVNLVFCMVPGSCTFGGPK